MLLVMLNMGMSRCHSGSSRSRDEQGSSHQPAKEFRMSFPPSPIHRLLPVGLKPQNIMVNPSNLAVHAQSALTSARCPLCAHRSAKVHSRYHRTIADLPWRNVCVTLKIQARRFFCINRRCNLVTLLASLLRAGG